MIKVRKTAKYLFQQSVVAFLAGIIISIAIDILYKGIDTNPENRQLEIFVGIISILLSFIGVFSVLAFEALSNDIETQLNDVGLVSLWMAEQNNANEGFARSGEIALSAKQSIYVISHYIPMQIDMKYTGSRQSYLGNGIESAIRIRLDRPDMAPITYKRIIQSDFPIDSGGVFKRQLIKGDPQTFDHCQRVFTMFKGQLHSNVHVDFRVSKPIPSFPSTLIVDDRYILFALSTRAPHPNNSNNQYAIVGVLLIEDRDGRTVQGFKNMFERFYENSQPISTIED